MPKWSTIPDINKVINLGHMLNVPLIRLSSELVDRSEPHGLISLSGTAVSGTADARHGRRGVPGVARLGGYREGYTGY